MNSTSCLLILLALSGCVFAKSTFRDGLDIVRKQNPSNCATSDSQECANEVAQIDITQFDITTPEGNRDYQEALLAVTCRADCFSASIQQQVCLVLMRTKLLQQLNSIVPKTMENSVYSASFLL